MESNQGSTQRGVQPILFMVVYMNRLELQGRDRDRLIALKRKRPVYRDGKKFVPIEHWSTDWNDAWELWDELDYPKQYEECEADDGQNSSVFLPLIGIIDGDSFADAVSKAWLKWYYNTQWVKK